MSLKIYPSKKSSFSVAAEISLKNYIPKSFEIFFRNNQFSALLRKKSLSVLKKKSLEIQKKS